MLDLAAAAVARRLRPIGLGRRQIAEQALGQLHQARMLDLAGSGKHQAPRPVVPSHILDQRLARHLADDGLRTQDRAAHRLVGVGRLLQQVEHEVVGGVLDLPDLLQDHMPLLLELSGVEARMLQDVGQDVGGEFDVGGQDPGVVGGVLARGVGIQAAADPLDLLGDGPGRPPTVPLNAMCSRRWATPLTSAAS